MLGEGAQREPLLFALAKQIDILLNIQLVIVNQHGSLYLSISVFTAGRTPGIGSFALLLFSYRVAFLLAQTTKNYHIVYVDLKRKHIAQLSWQLYFV